ncbi:hypothetical protein DFJ74DRAFT_675327 [Hyaloraphidium curvatum]|nr:hypothetical protein DFJ74DRAFT_675327 [Hyaloraphidium curvatum]
MSRIRAGFGLLNGLLAKRSGSFARFQLRGATGDVRPARLHPARTFGAFGALLAGIASSLLVTSAGREVLAESPAESRLDVPGCLESLRSAMPEGGVSTDETLLRARSKDVSIHPPSLPYAVVFCTNESEVATALKICNRYRMPVVPHASLTSLEGQTVPSLQRGVVIDVSQMNSTVAVYRDDMQAVVQAGKAWNDLNEELAPYGLMLGPDPGLGASIGGMAACSCSGTRAWRLGTMKSKVVGMRFVLPDGQIVTTRRRPNKSSAGYDITSLMIGSEGTLGIITELTVKLHKIPEKLSVAVFAFPDVVSATKAVHDIVMTNMTINRLELMDENAIKGANRFAGTSYPETATLLVEYAGSPRLVEEQKERVEQIAQERGALSSRTAQTDEEYDMLWESRRNLTWSVYTLRDDGPASDFDLLTTDVGVPSSELAGFFAQAKAWKEELGIVMQQLAHAGDATHHSNTPIRRNDPVELAKALEFSRRLATRAIELGGTCTAEHGVGLSKIKYLEQELGPEAIEVMRKIKAALDPNLILNPGHVLPPRRTEK